MKFTCRITIAILLMFFAFDFSRASSDRPGAHIDSIHYRVEVQGEKARVHTYRKITVTAESGDDAGVVTLSESSLEKLVSANVTVDNGNGGNPVKVVKKDMVRYCGYGEHSAAYSEDCFYTYRPTVSTRPYEVVIEAEYEAKTLYIVRGDLWYHTLPFASMVVELIGKTGDEFRSKTFGDCTEQSPIRTDGKVVRRWIWNGDSVAMPSMNELNTMPPGDRPKYGIKLVATSFVLGGQEYKGVDSWDEIASVYRNLSQNKYDHTVLETRPASAESPHAMADSIYTDIITRGRYFLVDIGISGWQTQAASFTEKTLWADCKGLTTWLVSRARANDLKAFPALVLTRREGSTDVEFPDFSFNHVITMIVDGEDTLWYDPTCDICPPGVLPSGDQGIWALVVTDSGGTLVRTPESKFEDNVVHRIVDIELSESGTISATAKIECFGTYSQSARSRFRQAERTEWNDVARNYLADDIEKRFVVDSVSVEGLANISHPMVISFRLQGRRPVDKIGNTFFFQPFQFSSAGAYRDYELETRASKVSVGLSSSSLDSVIIHGALIERVDSITLPKSTSYDSGAVRIGASYSLVEKRATMTLEQVFRQNWVQPMELLEFANRRKAILDNRLKLWVKSE